VKSAGIYWILLTLVLFSSCLKEKGAEITPVSRLTEVMPSVVQIGDTITIKGTGLNCSTCRITFNDNWEYETVSASATQIVGVVPTLHDEEISIVLWNDHTPVDTATIALVGFFPLNNSPTGNASWGMQTLDESTFFVYGENGLFLSDNGGDSWAKLLGYDSYVRAFFFLTKEIGWVVSSRLNHPVSMQEYVIDFTSDGGHSFQPIDTVECSFRDYPSKIIFKSATEGYMLSRQGVIFYTSDNSSFERIYQFPEDAEFTAGFQSLSVYNNTVMATGEASIGLSDHVAILIVGKNNAFTYGNVTGPGLSGSLGKVQLLSENDVSMMIGNRLCFSGDAGATWTKRSEMDVRDFYFDDSANGVAISYRGVQSGETIVFTHDGGVNWAPALGAPHIPYTLCMAFSGNIGMVGQSDPFYGIWKYVGQ
jgi:photosystem II stability/assembly factor-like uncharacterized protein